MKLQLDQKDIFDKLFVLGFTWLTPMSVLGNHESKHHLGARKRYKVTIY